jgi:hypothetical protein
VRDIHSVAPSCGYVVTDAGREALREAEECQCRPAIRGRFVVCVDCGTALGALGQVQMRLSGYQGKPE